MPLLIFPCTIKSRSSLLAPAHPGGPGKRAVKRLWWWWCGYVDIAARKHIMISQTRERQWGITTLPISPKRVASTKLCPIEANDREAQNYYRHETTRRCEYDTNILGLHVVDLSLHIVLFYVCIFTCCFMFQCCVQTFYYGSWQCLFLAVLLKFPWYPCTFLFLCTQINDGLID